MRILVYIFRILLVPPLAVIIIPLINQAVMKQWQRALLPDIFLTPPGISILIALYILLFVVLLRLFVVCPKKEIEHHGLGLVLSLAGGLVVCIVLTCLSMRITGGKIVPGIDLFQIGVLVAYIVSTVEALCRFLLRKPELPRQGNV